MANDLVISLSISLTLNICRISCSLPNWDRINQVCRNAPGCPKGNGFFGGFDLFLFETEKLLFYDEKYYIFRHPYLFPSCTEENYGPKTPNDRNVVVVVVVYRLHIGPGTPLIIISFVVGGCLSFVCGTGWLGLAMSKTPSTPSSFQWKFNSHFYTYRT